MSVITIALVLSSSLHANTQEASVESLIENIETHFPDFLGDAENYMEQALELAPDNPKVNYYCGMIYGLRASEGFMKAIRFAGKSRNCLEQAVAIEPDNLQYREALFNYYLNAPGIVGGGEDRAKQEVINIQELNREAGAIAHLRVINVFHSRQYGDELQRLATQYPEFAGVQLRLGLNLQEQGKYSDAHSAFLRSAELTQLQQDKRDIYLNGLYQIARNAVFSEDNIVEGINALTQYLEEYDSAIEIPEIAWAYARMAQLQSLAQNDDAVGHYKSLAEEHGQANDRALHDLLAAL
ncbi:hypothetical protein CWI83_09600 [Pseudidiomarina taiwanensis]|uniref:Tetratricopeptide repeat protein n=2 Tax=Pseudidiomarina taiwanensis TaxID=337250 RepID=A0A432ZCC6_9GAMM|nr:hypothetical protein CWI83_09600 [Pseudidiomarina taiwanensis]